MTTTSTEQLLAGLVRKALAPPERVSVSEWAERHRVILDKGASEKGRWRNDRVPYAVKIMDAFSDPAVREIYIIKREQIGGTEMLLNMFLWALDQAPGPALWAWANEKNAGDFCQTRLMPTVRGVPAAARHLSGRKRDEKSFDVAFDRMDLRLRGSPPAAGGIRNLETYSYKYVFIEELPRCDSSTIDMVRGRVNVFADSYKIVGNGTPHDWESDIHELYLETAHGGLRYWTPCPECGAMFVRSFDSVRWIGGSRATPEQARSTAWLVCPHCEHAISGHHNMAMLRAGVWAPGWDENTPPREQSLPPQEVIDEALHAPKVGFWVGEFDNPFQANPYGQIAEEFVLNACQVTRDWTNRRRGRPWRVKGDRMETHDLMARCRAASEGGYRFGVAPAWACVLAAGIDVQLDRVVVVVYAFGPRAGRCGVVWAESIPTPGGIGRCPEVLKRVRRWTFPTADGGGGLWGPRDIDGLGSADAAGGSGGAGGAGGGGMRVSLLAVDSGKYTDDVYAACAAAGGRAAEVWPVKGQPGRANDKPWTIVSLDKNFDGSYKPVKDSRLVRVNVDTWYWKDKIMAMVGGGGEGIKGEGIKGSGDRGIEGEGIEVEGGGGGAGTCCMEFPEVGTEPGVAHELTSHERLRVYCEQLTSEERQTNVKKGRWKREWVMRSGKSTLGNHGLDATVYLMCVAFMRGVQHKTRPIGLLARPDAAAAVEHAKKSEPGKNTEKTERPSYWEGRKPPRKP